MPINMKKSNKGVTLIALMVTIIVLLILASITLATLTGDNGIILHAQNAKNSTELSDKRENETLKNIFGYYNNINNGGGDGNTGAGHTHSYTSDVTTEATCETAGIRTYTCSCGDWYTEPIPALGHNWGTGVVTTQPTSTTAGVRTYTCSNCGQTRTEPISATGSGHTHSYTSKVTKAATCTENGVRTYTCSCGDTYTETIYGGHSYSWAYTPKDESTHYYRNTCSKCGTQLDEQINSHTFVNGVCTKCKYVHDHNWNSSTGTCTGCGLECSHPSWTEDSSGYGVCVVCGCKCSHPSPVAYAEKINNNEHNIINECNRCGVIKVVRTATHVWCNGTCTVCEWDCVHPNWTEDSDPYDGVINIRCMTCTAYCEHQWNTAGEDESVCLICKNSCLHKGTLTEWYLAESTLGVEKYHTRYLKCDICGSQWNYSEQHSFANGKCSLCNYEQ